MNLLQLSKRLAALFALTAAFVFALTASASADVLVSDPGPHATDCVKVGVWYQSFSGGPRNAEIKVLSKNKRTLFDKHVKAVASHWKYWSYCPDRSGRYLVRYYTPGGKYQRWVHVRVT